MAEYDARMAKAATFIDGNAEACAARMLSAEAYYNYQAWTTYAEQCKRVVDRETFPNAVVWPEEPLAYTLPAAPIAIEPSDPQTAPAP